MREAIAWTAHWSAANSWTDVPGVRITGAVLGALLLVAAIRAMFGRNR